MAGNPYHDRRGRFTTASGVGSGGTSAEYGRGRQRGTAKQTKLSQTPALPFTVVWFEGSHANKQEKTFNTFEEAQTWARENIDPMTNGKVVPNLPDDLFDGENFDGRNYQSGLFSNKTNRYAAIVDTGKAAQTGGYF